MSLDHIPEESEHVPGRAIAWILAITALVIATCAVVVWALAAFRLVPGGASDVRRIELVPPAQPFSGSMQSERDRATARSELEEWRWVDRSSRRVRMPVDVAIDRYLQRRGGR